MHERIGILTGGGDCPGLNAVIRAVVRRANRDDVEVLGIKNGWRGLVEADVEPLTRASVTGILPRGGTILGTSRLDPVKSHETIELVKQNWERFGLGATIVVGGEGSLSAALDLWRNHSLQVVGVPKTIDNDVRGTDFTFGFDTAVTVVTDAVDRLHSTAESHHRVMVVEVMGRHTGWIAAYGGIAGGADVVLVPEHPFRLSHVCDLLQHRRDQGRAFSIVVVAEDAHPHPDEDFLPQEVKQELYATTASADIGTVWRGETRELHGHRDARHEARLRSAGWLPTAFDRVLATRFASRLTRWSALASSGMASLRGSTVGASRWRKPWAGSKQLDERFTASPRCSSGKMAFESAHERGVRLDHLHALDVARSEAGCITAMKLCPVANDATTTLTPRAPATRPAGRLAPRLAPDRRSKVRLERMRAAAGWVAVTLGRTWTWTGLSPVKIYLGLHCRRGRHGALPPEARAAAKLNQPERPTLTTTACCGRRGLHRHGVVEGQTCASKLTLRGEDWWPRRR